MLWVGAVVVESVHWLGDDIGRVDVDVPAIEGGFSLFGCMLLHRAIPWRGRLPFLADSSGREWR